MGKFSKNIIVVSLTLCSVACGRYEYHNQSKFRALNEGSPLLIQPVLNDGQIASAEMIAKANNRLMGGFSFTPSGLNNKGRPYEPVMFALRREKQSIQAETVLYESKNKNKTFFDTSTFECGLDKREKGISFDLTFQF